VASATMKGGLPAICPGRPVCASRYERAKCYKHTALFDDSFVEQ